VGSSPYITRVSETKARLRFAVIGVGGVGGYFGARLAEAGEEVTFIARGAHREAIAQRGLRVRSAQGDVAIHPARVSDDPSSVGVVDCIILGVKAWQVLEAAAAAAPMVGPDTLVLTLQNGVEAPEQVARVLGREHTIGGVAKIISFIAGPGQIEHAGYAPALIIGELDGKQTDRIERLRAAFAAARGVEVTVASDIWLALWEKFLFITAWAGVGAVTRAPMGVVRSVPETRRLMVASLGELEGIARALGIALAPDMVGKAMALIDSLPETATSSLQRDIAAGHPSELDPLIGAAVRLGERAKVPTPVNGFILGALAPLEAKARGQLSF
jgi:2-dehydropantoate 2-reductase